ncbi:myelin-associated glycoprotein-like [Leuresthes tenuis]|uniref:myelin-associated glycoprotein-like n=1 Tax=Leuresthes tenuis TaxID=355514 RepID=UPI003B5122ED
MELKLWLSFLMLHVIPDVQSANTQWIIDVPSRIPAVQGSCVVIPCSYAYPKPRSKTILNSWRGFWKRGNKIVSTNLRKWKLTEEFKKRTQLLGNLGARNCTMLLDGVRSTDVGPFHFRIEIPQYKSFSFVEKTVSIDVIRKPDPPSMSVEVADKVKVSCSVFHSCPTNLPTFSWSRSGVVTRRSKKLNKWKWETKSTLTFVPIYPDSKKTLNCTVKYRGGKKAEGSITLQI